MQIRLQCPESQYGAEDIGRLWVAVMGLELTVLR